MKLRYGFWKRRSRKAHCMREGYCRKCGVSEYDLALRDAEEEPKVLPDKCSMWKLR